MTPKDIINQLKKWVGRLTKKPTPQNEQEYTAVRETTGGTLLSKKIIAKGVKRFFDENYELRYNVLKQTEEFRPLTAAARRRHGAAPQNSVEPPQNHGEAPQKGSLQKGIEAKAWLQLTDRHLRRIAFEQMLQVGVAWSVDVELYVRSSLIHDYNPVTHFLDGCGTWDHAIDHIRAVARRVPTAMADWPDLFHRWLLAMVAQWQNLNRDYGNALVPILIGPQGTHKSTFCKLLLPPELREYYIDDIKLDNAEQVERMLARMLLVNIDEYNAKSEREQAKIKRVLSEKDVQTRRMRSDQYVMLQRTASFIATTNDTQPLTDFTGNRRYICCELTGSIDTSTPIDYCQLYAQAVSELQSGATTYLSTEENARLEHHNKRYMVMSSAHLMLQEFFTPAERRAKYHLSTTAIQQELAKHVRATDLPTLKKLGHALKDLHYQRGGIDGVRGWYAKVKETERETLET